MPLTGFNSVCPHRAALRLAAAMLVSIGLAACAPTVDSRGNMPKADEIAQLKPGIHTRSDVIAVLGSPTVAATFNDRVWYYIGRKTQTRAFFEAETTEQQVVAVLFDDGGLVKDIKTSKGEEAKQIEHVAKTTPTTGHSLTFMEQLFGNLGRFSRPE